MDSDSFACVAGKTALLRSTIVHHHFGELATAQTTEALYPLLVDFARNKDEVDPLLASFAATFDAPGPVDEGEFERLLWDQLQALHDIDVTRYPWSPLVDPDPSSPRFGFSVGEHPFFVVGLHPGASRVSRRFPLPTLVFNSHVQFERLKANGGYQRIQREVRRREIALQGAINPNLADFGEDSEARQYSGMAVADAWVCPFDPKVSTSEESEEGGTQ
ncbi:YqcI/YcgG family protein [Streptacidiphilus sp. NEAU-YB345]|uniref:YqcI/YcgG family protein n=1 Tax=Streptacidiphilus fuscans TaxID=2789292 RepID=A0A931B7W3_9ACTN|nr:YqcI/YcgG family protein [Streptacidiphilus fuscans]